MGVDESRRDQLVAGIDLAIDGTLEAIADEQHGIAPQRVMPGGMRDQPATGDSGAHEIPFRCQTIPYTDNFCCGKQPLR